MKKYWLTLVVSVFGMSFLLGDTIEITQKSSGKTLVVEVLSVTDGQVKIQTAAGKSFVIPIDSLTEESVGRIHQAEEGESPEASADEEKREVKKASGGAVELYSKVNAAIGHDLFGQAESLWEEDAAEVAGRLRWQLESRKEGTSSYRSYPKKDYQFLGTHPYCVTLYGGQGDRPERFSLVFANKGDFGSRLGMGEDHFRQLHPDKTPPGDLEEAIELDQELIAEKLVEGLGAPQKQYYGEKEDKRKVQRWDVGDHSFLLSARDGEYVHLLIVPKADAVAEGKVKFIKDSDLKKIQATNVKREENGDVWIDNIPMVNQGPKGYCAPATFERAMRYMRVPADMYLLATAATSPEGGTNTTQLADDSKRIVRSKARRIKELSLEKDLDIKEIKKFIDKGVPVLWQMCSLKKYNDLANERSKKRESVTDFEEWALEIQKEVVGCMRRLRKR